MIVVCLSVTGCTPPACQDGPDRKLQHDVELLVKDDGPIGQAAAARLIAGGRDSIPVLETGLYGAEPPARLRIVRTLRDLRSPEARPILDHLAEHDADPDVREAARTAALALTH
jgi:hypothetical protein